jgi:hypothetical protein
MVASSVFFSQKILSSGGWLVLIETESACLSSCHWVPSSVLRRASFSNFIPRSQSVLRTYVRAYSTVLVGATYRPSIVTYACLTGTRNGISHGRYDVTVVRSRQAEMAGVPTCHIMLIFFSFAHHPTTNGSLPFRQKTKRRQYRQRAQGLYN